MIANQGTMTDIITDITEKEKQILGSKAT